MHLRKRNNCLSMKRMTGILFLILLCFFMVGCSPKGTENTDAIQAVIKKEFNGPDNKFRELSDAVAEAQKANWSQEEYDAFFETSEYKEFANYRKDTYASYFTENGYDMFINAAPAFLYSNFKGDFKLSTSDIKIKQSENEPTSYTFTFKVAYEHKDEKTAHYNFEGTAIVPEKGKIGKIEFMDKDGLQQKLNDVNFEELTT
ncbi:hypothetical protein QWY14_11240 [Planococcus sp. N028]|uniref:Uncharacterized protein n=2 Tax=Planococcus shixiaomingii TaxID=3058393 RepID=A0ABT8N3R0_9BACL|nr:hypothetical protein [Planococcus sp. N028]